MGPELGNRNQSIKITAKLTGRVYWDDLFSGGCARVRMTLYRTPGAPPDPPGTISTTYSARACQIGGSLTPPSKRVDLSLHSINAHKVVVTTQIGANASTPSRDYRNTGSQTWYYGQVPQD